MATNGDSARIDLLAPKERECLRLVGQQLSSKEIGRELGISKASVDTYCNRARAKLGVADRREAARLVLAHDRSHADTPAAPRAPAAAPAPPQPAVAVAGPTLLPPLESVGTRGRIGLIFGGAVVIAIAFGMLLTALQALENLARSAAGLPPASAAPAMSAPPPAPQPKP